ncbi:MAG TPA: hypothetical protein PKD24_00505 [Pyrinomonadaceae bacterium]|nr:hypothetical protein [Pyrinomonadaceae bacterium]HMP64364.1 hypothetical protein [Pyrinomonadaceae bacterium]
MRHVSAVLCTANSAGSAVRWGLNAEGSVIAEGKENFWYIIAISNLGLFTAPGKFPMRMFRLQWQFAE